jgi:hypothetical protein
MQWLFWTTMINVPASSNATRLRLSAFITTHDFTVAHGFANVIQGPHIETHRNCESAAETDDSNKFDHLLHYVELSVSKICTSKNKSESQPLIGKTVAT